MTAALRELCVFMFGPRTDMCLCPLYRQEPRHCHNTTQFVSVCKCRCHQGWKASYSAPVRFDTFMIQEQNTARFSMSNTSIQATYVPKTDLLCFCALITDRKRIESRQRRRSAAAARGKRPRRKTGRKKGRLKPIKSARKSAKQQKFESLKGPATHEQQLKETASSSSGVVFLQ